MLEQKAWESLRQEVGRAPRKDHPDTPRQPPGEAFEAGMTASMAMPPIARARSRTRRRRRKRSRLAPWGYLLPDLAVYGVFWIVPVGYSVYLAFFDGDMASPEKLFVAGENYQRVFADPLSPISLRNTVIYVIGAVGVGTTSGLGLALLVQSLARAREVYRFLFFLPVVTSITVVSLIWLSLLNTRSAW